jgi:thiamine-phosphate pyrophosphorylase
MDVRRQLAAARLYVVSSAGNPVDQAGILCRAIDGGADIVQLRNKTAPKGDILRSALIIAAYARQLGALFIVNDHLDIAMACRADGVHLGQEDIPVFIARRLWGDDHLIGLSTHTLDQALGAEAEGADYIGVGPVYTTPTKPGRKAVGTTLVGQVAKQVTIPWFAIGGIDSTKLSTVTEAGAKRVAVVRAVCDARDPAMASRALKMALSANSERLA